MMQISVLRSCRMPRWIAVLTGMLLLHSAHIACSANYEPNRAQVERFAMLPAEVRQPESIIFDPVGKQLYVATFDAREPASARNNVLMRFSNEGRLLGMHSFGATPLTGLAFAGGKVYLLNFGRSVLQRIDAEFDSRSVVEDVVTFAALVPAAPVQRHVPNPDESEDVIKFGSSGVPAVNGLVFDRAGNLYVSDSFQGAIYLVRNATTCRPCRVDVVAHDTLLSTPNFLPFGANGMALDESESTLYIANAGDGRILSMRLPSGKLEVFAEGLHGADGILYRDGLLWVAANQDDAIVALDARGRPRVRIGQFEGLDGIGAPIGLLFPASIAVVGDWMVVANLALSLTARRGDEWEEEVKRWTLAKFRVPDTSSTGRDPGSRDLGP